MVLRLAEASALTRGSSAAERRRSREPSASSARVPASKHTQVGLQRFLQCIGQRKPQRRGFGAWQRATGASRRKTPITRSPTRTICGIEKICFHDACSLPETATDLQKC